MQGKKTANLERSQSGKMIKSIKVLHSCSHADRPKISMEGKWLEQLGFHIGDRLQVSYRDRYIFISHAVDEGSRWRCMSRQIHTWQDGRQPIWKM